MHSPLTKTDTRYQSRPFPHVVTDNAFPVALITQAVNEWPDEPWPQWFRYDTVLESKRTCAAWASFPTPVRDLMGQLLLWPAWDTLGLRPAVPSDLLHGGGMNDMKTGEALSCHLDHNYHALTGLKRVCSAVLFLSDWQDDWGGQLELWPTDRVTPTVRISPRPNRLVCFANTEEAYHSVAQVTCPVGVSRKALCAFWYSRPGNGGKRPRAEFTASGPELLTPDPVKEMLRRQRMR